ncbi:MAG: hypothetical protein WC977_15155 [Anaerovoracaceae bacterium]
MAQKILLPVTVGRYVEAVVDTDAEWVRVGCVDFDGRLPITVERVGEADVGAGSVFY